MKTIKVPEHLIYTMFRYALGRRSYIVSQIVSFFENNWDKLETKTKQLIHREIQEALDRNRAGAEMDKQQWKKLLKLN